MTTARVFRYVAIIEALSWLLLIVATIVKYAADAPLGVKILGPVHGTLFIAYVLLAGSLKRPQGWTGRTLAVILADSIIPGGGFIVARRADLNASPVLPA